MPKFIPNGGDPFDIEEPEEKPRHVRVVIWIVLVLGIPLIVDSTAHIIVAAVMNHSNQENIHAVNLGDNSCRK